MDIDRAMDYLTFVEERHKVWEKRQAGLPQPWTDEPIVATRKFTSVFRILDYGSQYVMTDLIDHELDPADQLLRLFLYRHTGQVMAWQYLDLLGLLPTHRNLDNVHAAWKDYKKNRPVFTGAYLVYPQSSTPGTDKVDSIIQLTKRLWDDQVFQTFVNLDKQSSRFGVLRAEKGVADFMSMQVLTDWGYTPHCGEDRENEFVVCGPGAKRGAAALGMKPDEFIRWGHEAASTAASLYGRPPSLMDIQNTACEFSKWVRYASKPLPDKPYQPAHPGPQPTPVLPEHWL